MLAAIGCSNTGYLEDDFLAERDIFIGDWENIDEIGNIRNDSLIISIERELEVTINENTIIIRNLVFGGSFYDRYI